jgi:redox-sensitive bicupin YhaK (pirin superfamily)
MSVNSQAYLAKGEQMSIGQGFTAKHLNSDMFNRVTGPVLMLDDFHMVTPTFPPHPHAGISAVTYVLPESNGAHVSYDSLGNIVDINPGDLHWFCAGRGAVHTEEPKDVEVHGLQLFINLPIKDKRNEPFGAHLNASDVPIVTNGNLIARVVIGSYGGATSPFRAPSPISLFEFSAKENLVTELPVQGGWGGLIYVINGKIKTNLGGHAVNIDAKHGLGFEGDGSQLLKIDAESGAHWVALFGEALHEPYALGGPIIMESNEANQERFSAYRRGEFGMLSNYPKA